MTSIFVVQLIEPQTVDTEFFSSSHMAPEIFSLGYFFPKRLIFKPKQKTLP